MRRLLGIFLLLFFLNDYALANNTLPLNNKLINNVSQPVEHNIEKKKQETTNISELALNDKVLNLVKNAKQPLRPSGEIYQETQKEIDFIDPTKATAKNSYPGLRGPNQLIIYTPTYGERTGTNEFGTEAIVRNNMVVSLNGADSIIPKDGFVISGHGNAKKWIIGNIQVGSKVYIDYFKNEIKVFLTPDSLLYAAKERIKEVNDIVEYYRKIDILYNDKKATEYLNESKNYLRKAEKRPEKTQQLITSAMETLNEAIKNAIPYIEKEKKGIWLRPTETSESDIEKTIKRLSNAGITDIFLETYFHGKTIYPSKYLEECGVISQREEFIGFDPLEIWVKKAHKHNMKIHIWFETFYVGNNNPETSTNEILSIYPHWSNKRLYNYNSQIPVSSLSEHNGYFLDPSNIQVQTYLLNILDEIITNYRPDGINLDYIRYPQTVDPSFSNYAAMNWGYTENARNEFQLRYGIDPINIKYGTPAWDTWTLYRQNQITKFLIKAKNLTAQKNILLTAVIFPDLEKSTATKMQNWKIWSINNYVDGLTPLILTGDRNTADLLIEDVIKNTRPETQIYPGIFVTFMGGSIDDLLLQIHKTRKHKTKGAILFDYNHLNNNYIDALTTRVFNKEYEPRDVKIETPQRQIIEEPKKKKKKRTRR